MDASLRLPEGMDLVAVLSRARGGLVARVRTSSGADLVLRRGAAEDSREAASELAVLARVAHPGLAGLTAFGVEDDGAVWVARPWIEGTALAEARRGLSSEDCGRVLVEIAVALQHLHERGFVHGDLKSANVILRDDGSAVIADYGLSSAGEEEARGSLLHMAPEIVRGGAPDFRSDLFSLGVLAHELLTGALPDPRTFYARFPAEPFLVAAGGTPAQWPEWARDGLSRLLDSDPTFRPNSAIEFARSLAANLGLVLEPSRDEHPLPWSVGRAAWLRALPPRLAELRDPLLIVHPDRADAREFVDELALECAASGLAHLAVDLERELLGAHDSARLDERIAGLLARARGRLLLVSAGASGSWERRALRALLHGSRLGDEGPRATVLSTIGEVVAADFASLACEVPPSPAIDDVLQALGGLFAGEDALREYGTRLLERAGGSSVRLRAMLRDDREAGWILGTPGAFRLRSGAAAANRADARSDERCAGRDPLSAMSPAIRGPLARWLDGGVDAEFAATIERLRESGSPELALDLAQGAQAVLRARGAELPPAIAHQLGLVWAALGEHDRAREVADSLALAAAAADRALGESIRGEVHWRRHEFALAEASLRSAAALDAGHRGRAYVPRASEAFARGRDEELDQLARDVAAGTTDIAARDRFNVRNLHAMSLLRRGMVDRARDVLEKERHHARTAHEAMFEAGALVNLGTLERRTGDLERARAHFRDAARVYADVGAVEGLAQARALEGGTIRELGDPLAACALLAEALGVRERCADRVGATAVRGMLGLAHVDTAEFLTAIGELERAASELEAQGRGADALFLRCRASEARARLGASEVSEPLFVVDPLAFDGDPRALSAQARVRWLRGDRRTALTLARAAAGVAAEKARTHDREEAEHLLWCLSALQEGGVTPRGPRPNPSTPRLRQEREVLDLLGADGGEFHAARAEALALDLERRGRLDVAARLQLALAARSTDRELAQAARARAGRLLEILGRGLTESEAASLREHLLGIPDPWPTDLKVADPTLESERTFDMDIAAFLDINRRLAEQQELRSLLGVIVECALEISGGTRGFLLLEREGRLVFESAFDSRRGDIEAPEVEISASVVRLALAEGRTVRISNATEEPGLAQAASVRQLSLRSILCVPFQVEEGLRGVIYVDHDLREAQFGPRAEVMLGHLANQAALAIRNVRHVEAIRELNERLSRQVEEARSDLRRVRESSGAPRFAQELVGGSEPMARVRDILSKAAASEIPVLVLGASGTGKELAARAIHENSKRRNGPWVGENCGALPESLIESELFGFRKGAFTGADRDSPGMFERASGGTLFLDEIGELPLDLQVKLLRVLETGEIRRLGESDTRAVDFRLVAATNRDLQSAVVEGTFRADLLYRLDGLRILMPPLSRRVEDVPELVDHFLRANNRKYGQEKRVSEAVVRTLCSRPWPGNVRELANEVARLFLLSENDLVDPTLVRPPGDQEQALSVSGAPLTLAQIERRAIEDALVRTGGDKQQAAELLDVSRAKIYQRLAQWRQEDELRERRS